VFETISWAPFSSKPPPAETETQIYSTYPARVYELRPVKRAGKAEACRCAAI